MKFAAVFLSVMLAASPVFAGSVLPASLTTKVEKQKLYTPKPEKKSQTAQVYGAICRNGAWYCVMPMVGLVGTSCCGCGFCGWWSNW